MTLPCLLLLPNSNPLFDIVQMTDFSNFLNVKIIQNIIMILDSSILPLGSSMLVFL